MMCIRDGFRMRRSHWNGKGRRERRILGEPKRPFATMEEAEAWAYELGNSRKVNYEAYRCALWPHYHVGKGRPA